MLRRNVLVLLLFAVVGALCYANSLNGPFVFDDIPNIRDNYNLRLDELTLAGIKGAGFQSPLANRPVANISFALNYYFHGYDVRGYHVVNIFIHIITGFLLYLLIITMLGMPALAEAYGQKEWLALSAALIWLVHPMQTQSVTYIVQRMNSMAAMFFILSLLCYLKGRLSETRWQKGTLFAAATLAGILSLGTKEIAATLPIFILLFEWYFLQNLSRAWLRRGIFFLAAVLGILCLISLFYLGYKPLESLLAGYATRDFTLEQRVLTEFRVVIFYLSLLFFPLASRLNIDHDFALSFSMLEPVSTVFAIAGVVGLLAMAFYLAKKEPLISFCIIWYFGNLAVESSVVGLEIIFEHRTYLPSMFISLLFVIMLYRLIGPGSIRTAVVAGLVVLLGVTTYQRNIAWGNEFDLWQDAINKSPKKARVYNEAGMLYYERLRCDEAIPLFEKSISLKNDFPMAHNNLGLCYLQKGEIDLAVIEMKQAVGYEPGNGMYHVNLGIAYLQKGLPVEANKEIELGKELRRKKRQRK